MSRLLPPVTALTQPYWDGCNAGELRLQQCVSCRQHQFYPRNFCSHCDSTELAWVTASGNGIIASFTVVRRGISKAYAAPYIVALVDLQEGPRMMSNIIDVEPEQVAIGAAVRVSFDQWSEEVSLPVFKLVIDGGQT
jgi:uncharacterized OB-fold protein